MPVVFRSLVWMTNYWSGPQQVLSFSDMHFGERESDMTYAAWGSKNVSVGSGCRFLTSSYDIDSP